MYPRIRRLREECEYSQRVLAEYLHCSQVGYSHYENGRRDLPTYILIHLAAFYKTSIDYLVDHTDDPRPCRKRK